MNNQHILEILDEKRFDDFGGDELENIQSHCARCSPCRQSFEAARISSVLLKVRAENPAIEPSPFFQAKMMNALRAKQNLRKPIAAFRRWWQASSVLVCSMLLLVFAFVALTLLAPKSNTDEAVSTYNLYTTDSVILNQKPRNLTTEQTLEVIYTERKDSSKR